jgi:ribA/ribD-fused uncharacterized protein
MNKTDGIYGFTGKMRFLSNFARLDSPIAYLDHEYWYSENAYQAAKCVVVRDRKKFVGIRPNDAKHLGQEVKCRLDWNEVKIGVMEEICRLKFQRNPRMKQMLLDTGELYLEETNHWRDQWWGVCKGSGRNELGKILMKLRTEFRAK